MPQVVGDIVLRRGRVHRSCDRQGPGRRLCKDEILVMKLKNVESFELELGVAIVCAIMAHPMCMRL